MSTYTLIINPEFVLALREFIPAKDYRPSLLGLHVELHQGEAFLVATNGHVLGAYHHPEGHNLTDIGTVQFTVPKELLTGLKPRGSVAIGFDDEHQTCTLGQQGTSRSANVITDRYPDWRRVVPGEITGEVAQYDPLLMTQIHKAAKQLGTQYAYVTPNGMSGGYVDFGREELFGVIMPLTPVMARSFPEWCRA